MSVHIDADAVIRWEKGEFDLPKWLNARAPEPVKIPAVVWQQLSFGVFDWAAPRSEKRELFLQLVGAVAEVIDFSKAHAERAAELTSRLKREQIGLADFQIAATALLDDAELLTFNDEQFRRVPSLKLAKR